MNDFNEVYLHSGILFNNKQEKVLLHATTYVHLENITQTRRSTHRRPQSVKFYLHETIE